MLGMRKNGLNEGGVFNVRTIIWPWAVGTYLRSILGRLTGSFAKKMRKGGRQRMAKRSTTGEPFGDVDRAWSCPGCGTALAVTSVGLTCLKCGEIQKCLLSIEETGVIIKMAVESFPKRVRLDAEGRVCEEFIDVMTLYRAWKAIERLNLGN